MDSIILQGVSPVLPITAVVILLLLSLAVSWWSYHHLNIVKTWKKGSLITLRALSLGILVLLLLNPFRTVETEDTDSPRIAVYLDDSQSIAVTRGEYDGLSSYRSVIDGFKSAEHEDIEYHYFLFSQDVINGDEIEALGTETHLNRVIEHIAQYENEYQASILFSDGIFTQGRNPVFAAQQLSNPVITIPVGDTTTVKDVLIAGVDFNETGYTNTLHRFTADIQQIEFAGEEATVQFLVDGELVQTETISFNAASESHLAEFTHEFTEPGFYNLEINVPPLAGEYTERNNSSAFTLEVVDEKTRILSVAFEVHPDVSAIRRVIATDQQNELLTSTYLGNGRFTGTDPRQTDQDYNLIVLHGLPDTESGLAEWLNDLREPVVFITTPASYGQMQNYRETISLRPEELRGVLDVHILPESDGISHPLLELGPSSFQRFPSLKTYDGEYASTPLSEILLTAEFQRNPTDIPLLLAEDTQSRRLVTVNAFGWYRFPKSRNQEAADYFIQLFTNIIGWATTPPENKNLELDPVKPSFSENETVEMRAVLTNERGERESDAHIELHFYEETEGNEGRVFRMNAEANGVYRSEIGTYPQGVYRVEGIATKNNREIGRAESRVRISQSAAELVNTRRNDELLSNIASITGGLFLQNYQFEQIRSFIDEQNLNEISGEITTDFVYTFQSGWWFVVIILLLSAEWLLRRTVSLP